MSAAIRPRYTGQTHDLAALVLDVLLGLVELVVRGILCEGDLAIDISMLSHVEGNSDAYVVLRHVEKCCRMV